MAFRETYKKAYDNICPPADSLERILEQAEAKEAGQAPGTGKASRTRQASETGQATEQAPGAGKAPGTEQRRKAEKRRRLQPGFRGLGYCAAALLAMCLMVSLALPAMAREIPEIYRIIEAYVPELAAFVLPLETRDTKQGITMQVEAVEIVENTAQILISFRDAQDSAEDLIAGPVDLYDSYRIRNFDAKWQAGGCSFLEYDPGEDKAYFKIDLTASDSYSKSTVRFSVRRLLTRHTEEERVISMEALLTDPTEKLVRLSGGGSAPEFPFFEKGDALDPRPQCRVMDIVTSAAGLAEELTVTGVAYQDGVLRVQYCRGNLEGADRHANTHLKDAQGNVRSFDQSVSWQEELEGERLTFEEQWFLISEAELESCELYGMFYITDGSVEGDWEVTFRTE